MKLPRYDIIQIKCGALYKNKYSTDKDFCLLRIFTIENTIPIGPPTKKFTSEFFVGTKKLSKSAIKTKCYTIGFEKLVADQNSLSLSLQQLTARPKENLSYLKGDKKLPPMICGGSSHSPFEDLAFGLTQDRGGSSLICMKNGKSHFVGFDSGNKDRREDRRSCAAAKFHLLDRKKILAVINRKSNNRRGLCEVTSARVVKNRVSRDRRCYSPAGMKTCAKFRYRVHLNKNEYRYSWSSRQINESDLVIRDFDGNLEIVPLLDQDGIQSSSSFYRNPCSNITSWESRDRSLRGYFGLRLEKIFTANKIY